MLVLGRHGMLGLTRHSVRVVEHDPDWALLAAEACRDVRIACGGLLLDLQHVGSTAVPGLPAKPVLDLVAAVRTLESVSELVPRLAAIGYLYRGDRGDRGGHLFVAESAPDVRTIHLHVVELGGSQWRNYVLFRDLLRRSPATRRRYAELKRELGARFSDDAESYTAAKADFIRGALDRHLSRISGSPDYSVGE